MFTGQSIIIPFADVQHVEKHWYSSDVVRTEETQRGLIIITKHTTWSQEIDFWNNNVYLTKEEGISFVKEWEEYLAAVRGCVP